MDISSGLSVKMKVVLSVPVRVRVSNLRIYFKL